MIVSADDGKRAICSLYYSDDELEDLANARLIVAAPELLERAKALIANWENGNLSPYIQSLSRAIAKAEGR